MPILETDIKLLKSARMTDTPDGGGAMSPDVVVSGADNNIFDDVPSLARVYGATSFRKAFAAVLTASTDKYLGARFIIDRPAADPYIEALLFGASSLFDVRSQAQARVEAYLAQGPASSAFLYGPHLTGMAAVSMFAPKDAQAPGVGDVLVLVQNPGGSGSYTQFVRVASSASEVREFTYGDGSKFQRLIITLGLTDTLRHDFTGLEMMREDSGISFDNKTRVFDSVVADAANYYGIRPLELPATSGAFTLKADSAFSQLVPSTQVETAIVDTRANGDSIALLPSGAAVTMATVVLTTAQNVYIGGGVLPGSLTLVGGPVTLTDRDGVLYNGGTAVGSVDYENGILSASVNPFSGVGELTVTYTPAAAPLLTTKSIGMPITLANRSMSLALTLDPVPAPRSLRISYRSGGRWYVLRELGDGSITGAAAGQGAGVLNRSTGTIAVTLGALPDVGGSTIIEWAESASGTVVVVGPSVPDNGVALALGGKLHAVFQMPDNASLTSGGVSLSWTNSGVKTATDDGLGNLTGDATGTVDYKAGTVLFAPTTLPAPGTVVTLNANKFTRTSANVSLIVTNGTTSTATGSLGAAAAAGSVRLFVPVKAIGGVWGPHPLPGSADENALVSGTMTITDDGLGNLKFNGVTVGTINYTTGDIDLSFGVSVIAAMIPTTRVPFYYKQWTAELGGYHMELAGIRQTSYTGATALHFVGASGGAISAPIVYSGAAAGATTQAFTLSSVRTAPQYQHSGHTLQLPRFTLGTQVYTGTASGELQRRTSTAAAAGTVVGSVTASTGEITLSAWDAGTTTAITNFAALQAPPVSGANAVAVDSYVVFRTPAAPLRPSSLQLLFDMKDGTSVTATADSSGKINHARVKGRVSYEAGVVELSFCNPAPTSLGTTDVSDYGISGVSTINIDVVAQETLRYNCVAYTYLPLDASILGLDPVRLPQDGRVPVFKAGRVVVVHNTQSLAPQTVSNSQTVNCGRERLARIRVFGSDGLEITSGFSKNLDAGTITFTNVAGYSQPVTIEHRIEDEALCAEVQITGDLRLTRAITHDYPAGTSYVSSALIAGTLQAAAQASFAQGAWTGEWADAAIGAPILAQYNDTANPIVVTNAGAISERWAVIFTSNTAFNLVGEEVGQIITGDTATPLAPVNPATGVPYFTLQPAGWGSGWAAGNVLRFNTAGANFPLWVSRTVLQSPVQPPGNDQITISIRGDIDQ